MRRIVPLVVVLLHLCLAPAWAEAFSYDSEFEVRLCPRGTELAPPIAGDPVAAMELVRHLYELAGPKIGSRFVEPCYLLCLGDLRPYAAWNGFMVDPQPQDDEVYDRLNRYLVPRGFSLHIQKPRAGGQVASFSLYSLEGLDKRTRESTLPWVPRYRRQTGWRGYYAWMREVLRRCPEGDANFGHRVEGLRLGYPDAALAHYEELVFDYWPTTVDSTVPLAYYYQNGVPVFSLRCQDANDPGVVRLESEWNGFLEAAYDTPIHRRLAGVPEFLQARRLRCSDNPRYREAGRLGLTLDSSPEDLNSGHERWLALHVEDLVARMQSTSDLRDLARLGSSVDLSGWNVWAWLLRGSLGQEPAASKLYQAFRDLYPEVLLAHYGRELQLRARHLLKSGEGREGNPDGQPLALMLSSPDGPLWLARLAPEEQLLVFQAVQRRRRYAPMQALMEQADQGRGPLATLLRQLRVQDPELWRPLP